MDDERTAQLLRKLLSMNRLNALAALALVSLTACNVRIASIAHLAHSDFTASANIAKDAEIPADLKKLEIQNNMGDVRVTGVKNGPAQWHWRLEVKAGTDQIAREIASNITCTAETDGGRLRIVVNMPSTSEPHSVRSDFDVSLPQSADVDSKTDFGKMTLSDLAGEARARNQNGAIEIRHVAGKVTAQTSFGEINVSDTGEAVLRNQNGEIIAARLAGPLDAHTSFSALRAEEIHGPALLENQNGTIDVRKVDGTLRASTSFAPINANDTAGAAWLRNQNGPITLHQCAGDIDAKTSFSPVLVEDVKGKAVLKNQNGGISAQRIRGPVSASTSFGPIDVYSEGPSLECHNQNGPIHLGASDAVSKISADTSFSILEVDLPSVLKPRIVARTSFGNIDSDFPILESDHENDTTDGAVSRAPRIHLKNENGSIRIARK
jgi:hypothetical protein